MQTVSTVLQLPRSFTFHRGVIDFDYVLQFFDWNRRDAPLLLDLTTCESANYQAMALLVQYAWHAMSRGCDVRFRYGSSKSGPTGMLARMGALDWPGVLTNEGQDFTSPQQTTTFALRRRADVQNAVNRARSAIKGYRVGFPEYLSYVISELLYNATEHGRRIEQIGGKRVVVPSIFQFGNYTTLSRLSFLFSDLGIGIKKHLEQTYPPFPTDQDAIRYALRPNVSGTFRQQSEPYAAKNNAGMGLTYSSLMLRRLKGDMYIVSNGGQIHVSPEDITTRTLRFPWSGTFVLINLNVSGAPRVSLEDLLSEIRISAQKEVEESAQREGEAKYVVNVFNYFGKWAEDKDAAIQFRDRHLIPAVDSGRKLELDFRDVETAPHSFLNALLASVVQRLGIRAYQQIRIYNATGPIREIIDAVMESNTPKIT